jgi:mannose-6-phosphate isomerase
VVKSGPLAGKSLATLLSESGPAILGNAESFGKFPLLAKFIDARERLSVQVHPDDQQARTYGWGEFGKTESWFIIDAPKDARCIVGFKNAVTREAINHAIETNTLHTLLNEIPIRTGDVVLIPAGTVHAIMEGTLLYEIQETSDATLRLYDWGRLDSQGRPRPLHVRDALKVIDTQAHSGYLIPPITLEENGCLHAFRVACRYFALEHYSFNHPSELILPAKQSFRIITILSGSLSLKYPAGASEYAAGTTVLLPALMREVRALGAVKTEVLLSSVPDLYTEIIVPLRSHGIPREDILSIGGFREYNDLVRFLT